MKLWRWDLIFIFCLLFVACPLDDCDSGASPSETPEPTTTIAPEPEPEPDIPPIQVFEPEFPIRCVTGFALGIRTEAEILAFGREAQSYGYNMVRVGSETRDWDGGFFGSLKGPEPYTTEWRENLLRVLDTTARVPIAVELVVIFTVKGRPASWQYKYAERVGKLVQNSGHKHIVLSAANEPKHHTSILGRSETNELIRRLKPFARYLTVDDHGPPWDFRYSTRLLDFVAFHPSRNPEPSVDSLRKAVNKYGRVFFDESVCYASDVDLLEWPQFRGKGTVAMLGRGTEEGRKAQVAKHIRDTIEAGGWPCFHSVRTMAALTPFWAVRVN
jgi:hypothetical protein